MKNLSFIKLLLLLFILSSVPLVARSEYRVYQYYVKAKFSSPKDKSQYLVTSTLDPITYITYHGGHESLKADLLRTWTCEGYTGGNIPICDSPLATGKNKRKTASEAVGL